MSAPVVRCSECGEPARYTGVRKLVAEIDGPRQPAPALLAHRIPFCSSCAETLEARGGFVPSSVVRL
jgi:hypothetical protein